MSRGKELARKVLQDEPLSEEVREDWQDIIDLAPGWADGMGDDCIDDATFTAASWVLVTCVRLSQLPDNIIPSPMQTINFKFGSRTLIVSGTNAQWFDRT